uniref:hypothetical protein n=1 Tax=Lachnoclostridium phocaeense TaxID=1871021 RepID=UPI0026DD7C5C|nr:hypothetical protein [Lachnoclostridium phocaeense]
MLGILLVILLAFSLGYSFTVIGYLIRKRTARRKNKHFPEADIYGDRKPEADGHILEMGRTDHSVDEFKD